MSETFEYTTPEFKWTEAELKGVKKFYVEGLVSTTDVDDANEVVTDQGQDDITAQLNGRTITMDIEHSEWYDDEGNQLPKPKNTQIPVAKVIKAERRRNGTWAKVELNSDHPEFKSVWGSIKGGFLHSFSIAFYPVKAIIKNVNGVVTKFLEKLNVVNITLTGSPVNHGATFTPVMKAALKSIKAKEMSEENTKTAPEGEKKPEGEQKTEEVANTPEDKKDAKTDVKEEKKEDVKDNSSNDLMKKIEEQKEEFEKKLEEQKADYEKQIGALKETAAEAAENLASPEGPLATIKALKKEIDALNEKLEQPMLKAKVEKDQLKVDPTQNMTPLDRI